MALEGTESQEGSERIEIIWSNEAFKTMANSSSVPSGSFYQLLLYGKQFVVEDRGPTVKPTWLLSPLLGCYVKTSSLLAYVSEDLENETLSEVEVYELAGRSWSGIGALFQVYVIQLGDLQSQVFVRTPFVTEDREQLLTTSIGISQYIYNALASENGKIEMSTL
ncbi:hypothetical protein PAAG_05950 [Paracoccidioides lutzii Pb01]|uniref:Uncharacterized protein n=1 Tax=Paracoccidioides lutzii (strain ATCC MYA-826 / Pb01) TaxID=502779 RepID=C1H5A9_PARBA|nr:hypothetical protein PAAG_05950 [Paracoccidioides lutzii Pb01]EEH34903.2 hypothetical protein PAAG_05950 [Paracoccidioides lutzii Pb01]